MGPKKDAKKANAEVKEGEDPLVLLQNYQKYCKYVMSLYQLRCSP